MVDLDITIQIPENSSAKSLKVTVLPQQLTVKLNENMLLDGTTKYFCILKYSDINEYYFRRVMPKMQIQRCCLVCGWT